jgi:hypothetical protein
LGGLEEIESINKRPQLAFLGKIHGLGHVVHEVNGSGAAEQQFVRLRAAGSWTPTPLSGTKLAPIPSPALSKPDKIRPQALSNRLYRVAPCFAS